MLDVPWWILPLVAAVFALAGAGVAHVLRARVDWARKRWYEERRTAYADLLAGYERVVLQLRSEHDPDPLRYLDEVGPALAQVRLLASGPVRSAALAVHLLLEKLQTPGGPPTVPGVEPEKHYREVLTQVPLVLQQFEEAVREELEISTTPPVPMRRTG